MTVKIIPMGYIVEIETFENDADNYKLKCFDGLSKDEALFLKIIAEKFKSKNSGIEGLFGNGINPYSSCQYMEEADYVLEWFRSSFNGIPYLDDYNHWDISDNDNVYDCLEIIIGTWFDGQYFRYVKSYNIVYNPSEITFQNVDENLDII
jgi:hypothetical protein